MAQNSGNDENVIPLSSNEKVSQQGLGHTQNENALGSNNSPHLENRFLYFSNLNNDDDDDDAYKRDLKELSKCPPPLGLKLTITPSLVQLIEEKLNGVAVTVTPWQPPPPAMKDEKLKAVHFPMHLLRFGLFKIEAKYASHLVAKCYYAKRKLVWEILRNGLKEKIEIQWQNILAIRADIAENKPGILEIELARAPSFFRETEPKPGKHTRWDICGDFTAGQASKYRRHYLQFHPGVLDQHYVKLLQCDNRLLELSKGPFPSLQSPYFDSHLDQGTTHFSIGHVLHVHGSKTTSGGEQREQQPILKLPEVPTQQVQLFGNRMPLSPIAINDPTRPTSDICSLTNEAIINNQMLQETTLFLSGHDLHVNGSKTTSASEQQLICQQPEVPTQQVQQLGNMMPLSLIANDPTSPTIDICSPTNEAIINNQMLLETTLFLSSHDQHVHGSKTTSASEQQLICQQPMVPTQQVQQFGNMMPLSLIANDPTAPTSDICSPANEAINNQMLQDPNLAAWSEVLYYETPFPMESVPCASNLQRNGSVSNYELPNNINNMLLTGYNIPETVFDRRHMGNIVNGNATADLSMEAGPAYNTNTSTQIYQPNTSENSWNALDGSVQQQYYASNANLNPMHGNPFVDPRLFTT